MNYKQFFIYSSYYVAEITQVQRLHDDQSGWQRHIRQRIPRIISLTQVKNKEGSLFAIKHVLQDKRYKNR